MTMILFFHFLLSLILRTEPSSCGYMLACSSPPLWRSICYRPSPSFSSVLSPSSSSAPPAPRTAQALLAASPRPSPRPGSACSATPPAASLSTLSTSTAAAPGSASAAVLRLRCGESSALTPLPPTPTTPTTQMTTRSPKQTSPKSQSGGARRSSRSTICAAATTTVTAVAAGPSPLRTPTATDARSTVLMSTWSSSCKYETVLGEDQGPENTGQLDHLQQLDHLKTSPAIGPAQGVRLEA
jgi:hypothetical protein